MSTVHPLKRLQCAAIHRMRILPGIFAVALLTAATGDTVQARARLTTLHKSLAMYSELNGVFPTTGQGLDALVTRPLTGPKPKMWRKVLKEETRDPWGYKYVYKYPGTRNPKSYDLFSVGKDGKAGTPDDIWSE